MFERHRDKNGEISSKKNGNTLVGTLRKFYGADFAKGCAESDRLSDVLHKMDEPSLSKLSAIMKPGSLSEFVSRQLKSQLFLTSQAL
jgi:hypothetical protein